MRYSITDLENVVNECINAKDYENALREIKDFVYFVMPYTTGVVFSSPLLDLLCQKIGALSLKEYVSSISSFSNTSQDDLIVYITSEVMNRGGHNAVIKDLIALQPNKTHIILITNLINRNDYNNLQDYFGKTAQLIWNSNPSHLEKLIWLQTKLLTLSPGKTFLFNHHQDSVAIAAVQPSINKELLFYHHGDHHLCLGVHLEHALHIDPHSFGHSNCRNVLKVKDNIYWPLVTIDRPFRSHTSPFLKNGVLKTCSSGDKQKFETTSSFSYFDLIPHILKTTKGTHLHIGKLSQESLDRTFANMDALNISRERFIYIPWVESIWQAMVEHRIDVYINSFPFVGLKATIEVLGSGTPIIFYENYKSQLLGGHFIGYSEAFVWKKPEQLLNHLSSLNGTQLARESKLARECYEKNYRPEILVEELSKEKKVMKGFKPMPLLNYTHDPLQNCLDTLQEFNKCQNYFYNSTSWKITSPMRSLKDNYVKCKAMVKKLLKLT